MASVFISHSSRDRRFVEQELTPLLARHGIQPWYSREEIKTAEEWEQRIFRGLEECDWFLVVLSPRAVASDWVRKEVSWAVKNRPRRLIPLLLRKCNFPTLHQQLEAIQYVDYRGHIGIARGRLLAVWNRSMLPVSRLYEAVRIIQLVLRGVYWRLKRVAWCCGGIVTACILLVVGALLWVQDPVARQLAEGIPIGRCKAEPVGSAVQIFERGWLLARFARGQFFAIREQEPRIAWASYPDTYKSGQEADCRSVPNAHLLTAGFRKLYCDEQPNLASEIGPPRTPEVKAYVQFQEWSHGLLVFGLPGTSIGISGDEHKFTRLDGVFLARAGSRQSGEGSRSGWTEDTSRTSDACSAIWYRLVNGRESPLLAMRCTKEKIVPARRFIDGNMTCSRF